MSCVTFYRSVVFVCLHPGRVCLVYISSPTNDWREFGLVKTMGHKPMVHSKNVLDGHVFEFLLVSLNYFYLLISYTNLIYYPWFCFVDNDDVGCYWSYTGILTPIHIILSNVVIE